MVAESAEAEVRVDERVEAELGVEALVGVLQLLSMERRSLEGAGLVGVGEGDAGGGRDGTERVETQAGAFSKGANLVGVEAELRSLLEGGRARGYYGQLGLGGGHDVCGRVA